ncbi:uncharacterized protein LOC120330200 [Styela clava]
MALNLFYILALCCTSLGFIMLITALSSASWMTACMNNDNISNQLLQGKPCLYQGIFKSSMKAGNIISVNIPVDITSMPRSIMFGALALIVGLLFALVGGIVILIAFRGDQATYEGKNKVAQRTRSGCIMLLTAGLLTIVGMSAYTGGSAQFLHNPLLFMMNMYPGARNVFAGQPSFGKRMEGISISGLSADGFRQQIDEMDPVYGYAYIAGWMMAVLFMIGAVFAGFAKQTLLHQVYSEHEQPL